VLIADALNHACLIDGARLSGAERHVVPHHDLAALERELSRVLQYRNARDNEELELGVRCMAAGIFDDQGKLIAGLSISAPADRLEEAWLERLQATAARISASLGYTESQAASHTGSAPSS